MRGLRNGETVACRSNQMSSQIYMLGLFLLMYMQNVGRRNMQLESSHACLVRMLYDGMHYLMDMLRWVMGKKFETVLQNNGIKN